MTWTGEIAARRENNEWEDSLGIQQGREYDLLKICKVFHDFGAT